MIQEKRVVTEESYEAALDNIIERDFFPDLKEIKERNNQIPGYSSKRESEVDPDVLPHEGESLDQYLAKTVSEDDASFKELIEKDKARIREKCEWFYNLESTDDESKQIEFKKPNRLLMQGRNALMYVPDGIEQDDLTKPNILHVNTRISQEVTNSLNDKANHRLIQIESCRRVIEAPEKVDINGKTILDPHVGREYGLIPTPNPTTEDAYVTHITSGTPRSICNTPGFRMKESSKREQIGIKLSEDIVKNKRDKRKAALKQAMSSLTPNTRGDLFKRGGYLSPAARELLKRTSMNDSDSIGLRSSYTPSLHRVSSLRDCKNGNTNTPASSILTPTPNK